MLSPMPTVSIRSALSAHALLAEVAAQEDGSGLPLVIFPDQMKESPSFCPSQARE